MSSLNSNSSLGPFFSGTQLLMSPQEKELASIVYDLSLEELSLSPNLTDEIDLDPSDVPADSRIEVSRKNLDRISKLFESANEARERFVSHFESWEILRKENIQQLKDIIKVIREDKKKCSVGFLIGGAATVIGGAAVTGALLFPPAAPALLPAALSAYIPSALLPAAAAAAAYLPSFLLPAAAAAPAAASGAMVGGVAAATVGGAAVAGSAVASVALLEKRLEEAREVIRADELAFAYVEEWFRHTQGLIEATERLMGYDVIENWMDDLNMALRWCKDQNSRLLKRRDLFKAGLKLCILRLLPKVSVALSGFGAAFIASFLTFLFCLFWLKHRSLFSLVSRMRSMSERLRTLDPLTLVQSFGGAAAMVAQVVALSRQRGAAFGTFAALGLLGSVATVVLSSLDLHKGGCERAAPVEKVVEKLQEEFDILEEVHDHLVCI